MGRVPALALVGPGRHADDPLEMPGEMGLIGEAGFRGDQSGRHAAVEQLPGQADPQLVEVSVRRQAGLVAERPEQRERAHPRGEGEIMEARRIGQPLGQQVPDGSDRAGSPAGGRRQALRPRPGMTAKQPGQGRGEQAG